MHVAGEDVVVHVPIVARGVLLVALAQVATGTARGKRLLVWSAPKRESTRV